MSIKLSICIPTYNRANYLPTALESVLQQMNGRVELIICDNASIDETQKIVASYLQNHPEMHYFRLPQNVCPDRCFLQILAIAKGEYCWFLSDDDFIEKNSVEQVLSALDKNPDLSGICVNRKIYDLHLQHEVDKEPIQSYFHEDKLYTNSKECMKDLFAYFGYISGQICKKSLCSEAVQNTENIDRFFNAHIILYVIAKVILHHPKWLYLHAVYVGHRSSNDSLEKELGSYKRFLLDVKGFEEIASDLFGKLSYLYIQCLDQICRVYIKNHIKNILVYKREKKFSLKALIVMFPRYWLIPGFWLKNIPFLLIPRPLLLPLQKEWLYFLKPYFIKKRSRKLSGNKDTLGKLICYRIFLKLLKPIPQMARFSLFLPPFLLKKKSKKISDHTSNEKKIDLSLYEKSVYSQNGEDGVLEKIFSLLEVTNSYFVEFGVENGLECNTRYLRKKYRWKGLMMDGRHFNPFINLQREFITAENINNLFQKYNIPQEFDLLSIDIDYNDFYIWNALDAFRPRVVVIEYNGNHSPDEDKIALYNSHYMWDGTVYSSASILALYKLGRKKGYSLIYAEKNGVNLFFIRDDLIEKLALGNVIFKDINNIKALYRLSRHSMPPDPLKRSYTSAEQQLNEQA